MASASLPFAASSGAVSASLCPLTASAAGPVTLILGTILAVKSVNVCWNSKEVNQSAIVRLCWDGESLRNHSRSAFRENRVRPHLGDRGAFLLILE